MVDEHHSVLQLRGQVQGEAWTGQSWYRRRDPDQHVIQDVTAVKHIENHSWMCCFLTSAAFPVHFKILCKMYILWMVLWWNTWMWRSFSLCGIKDEPRIDWFFQCDETQNFWYRLYLHIRYTLWFFRSVQLRDVKPILQWITLFLS